MWWEGGLVEIVKCLQKVLDISPSRLQSILLRLLMHHMRLLIFTAIIWTRYIILSQLPEGQQQLHYNKNMFIPEIQWDLPQIAERLICEHIQVLKRSLSLTSPTLLCCCLETYLTSQCHLKDWDICEYLDQAPWGKFLIKCWECCTTKFYGIHDWQECCTVYFLLIFSMMINLYLWYLLYML